MPKMYYQGHGSFRLTTDDGRTIYVDPYAGVGYHIPADVILITHQHSDHNLLERCIKKPNCEVISNIEALKGGEHNKFDLDGIVIKAVEASNKNHNPKECVGFIIEFDEVLIYASGDTSKTQEMDGFACLGLDYAIFCGDGIYNMSPEEAADCARIIKAKHNILIHVAPGELYNRKVVDKWDVPNKLVIEPGQEIELKKDIQSLFKKWFYAASKEEKELLDTVCEYEETYFSDMLFKPNSLISKFIEFKWESDSGKKIQDYRKNEILLNALENYRFYIKDLQNGVEASVNTKNKTMTVTPDHKNNKSTILHEMIHIYEDVFDRIGSLYDEIFYKEILLIFLYNDLKVKIKKLDDMILKHTHVIHGEEITREGGPHGVLFFLKTLDLDLRCGYKLGTVCGYGRDADLVKKLSKKSGSFMYRIRSIIRNIFGNLHGIVV